MIVVITIHEVGFQQAPSSPAASDGDADALHEGRRDPTTPHPHAPIACRDGLPTISQPGGDGPPRAGPSRPRPAPTPPSPLPTVR